MGMIIHVENISGEILFPMLLDWNPYPVTSPLSTRQNLEINPT